MNTATQKQTSIIGCISGLVVAFAIASLGCLHYFSSRAAVKLIVLWPIRLAKGKSPLSHSDWRLGIT